MTTLCCILGTWEDKGREKGPGLGRHGSPPPPSTGDGRKIQLERGGTQGEDNISITLYTMIQYDTISYCCIIVYSITSYNVI